MQIMMIKIELLEEIFQNKTINQLVNWRKSNMKDMNITGNAIENLLISYAEHKAQEKLFIKETDFNVDKLKENSEFMYHKGFCECAERWIRCIGISPDSPKIEQMIKHYMESNES